MTITGQNTHIISKDERTPEMINLLITPEGHLEPWTNVSKMSKAHGFSQDAIYQKKTETVNGVSFRKWDGYTLARIPKNVKGAFKVKLLDKKVLNDILEAIKG